MMRVVSLAACFGAAASSSARAGECPDYASIAHPSVSPDSGFDMKNLEGAWYILAVSEPTIPPPCRQCGTLDVNVYTTTSSCKVLWNRANVSVRVGGHLGDATEPGNCVENFALFNKTFEDILMPNYFFNY